MFCAESDKYWTGVRLFKSVYLEVIMDINTGLFIIAFGYVVLLFFDIFFKSCAHYPYIKFLEGTGLQIKLFRIQWTTKAFNRLFLRWGTTRRSCLNYWFTTGLIFSLLLLPVAISLLFKSIYEEFFTKSDGIKLEPIVPGITLPAGEIGYYAVTLIICSIIHECGHALAAIRDDVNVNFVGVFIIFCLPIAYVDLSTDKLNNLNKWRQLKILCGGIWHNLVLSLVAYIIYLTIPTILSILYDVNKGAIVTSISKNSYLTSNNGNKGLHVDDIITQINGYKIKNAEDFYASLDKFSEIKPSLCILTDIIHNFDESVPLHQVNNEMTCCTENADKLGKYCFEFVDTIDSVLEIPAHACLSARYVFEKSPMFCSDPPHLCPNNLFCFRPILFNRTNIFKIERHKYPEIEHTLEDIIYVGLASDIGRTVEVSSFIPKSSTISSKWPEALLKIIKYIVLFSFGLAVINVIPCNFMDGQHIVNALLGIFNNSHNNVLVKMIADILNLFFTSILLMYCIYKIFIAFY